MDRWSISHIEISANKRLLETEHLTHFFWLCVILSIRQAPAISVPGLFCIEFVLSIFLVKLAKEAFYGGRNAAKFKTNSINIIEKRARQTLYEN